MKLSAITATIGLVVALLLLALLLGLLALVARALLTYIRSKEARQEKAAIKRSLGETLRARRTECGMTQEFVAETIGVSRQAVSKWESGASDPSTANLFALAKLFDISPEELLRGIRVGR